MHVQLEAFHSGRQSLFGLLSAWGHSNNCVQESLARLEESQAVWELAQLCDTSSRCGEAALPEEAIVTLDNLVVSPR